MEELTLKNFVDADDDIEITQWCLAQGEQFSADQVILEVLVGKAEVEISLGKAGRLEKILCEEGEVVDIDKVVAHVSFL